MHRRIIATLTALASGVFAVALFALPQTESAFSDTTVNAGDTFASDNVDAPTGLSATGGTTVTLSWVATADTYADGHRVYRSTSPGGPYTQIAEVTPRSTVSHVDAPAIGTYSYVVRAFAGTWESADSNEVTAVVASPYLSYADIGPSSTRTSSGTMTVSYPASTSENDLLLLVEVNAANQNITTPAGWTLLADAATGSPSQMRFTIWWKIAPAGETSVDLGVHTNASGANAWVARYARPGGYPPNPTPATAAISSGTAGPSASFTPAPDVTTNQPDTTVISVVAVRDANNLTLGTPNSFTLELATNQSAIGQPVTLAIAELTGVPDATTPPSPAWAQGSESGAPVQWAWATVAFS